MKTAMQELIDKVEHAISYNVEGGLVEKYTWTELFNDMEKALEKEKEQIISAVRYGQNNHKENVYEEGELYYNEIYNSDTQIIKSSIPNGNIKYNQNK